MERLDEDLELFFVKSFPVNWDKEKSGNKNNTVRETDDWDEERWKRYREATKIRLMNTDTKKTFTREISDKTEFKNLAIISWRS